MVHHSPPFSGAVYRCLHRALVTQGGVHLVITDRGCPAGVLDADFAVDSRGIPTVLKDLSELFDFDTTTVAMMGTAPISEANANQAALDQVASALYINSADINIIPWDQQNPDRGWYEFVRNLAKDGLPIVAIKTGDRLPYANLALTVKANELGRLIGQIPARLLELLADAGHGEEVIVAGSERGGEGIHVDVKLEELLPALGSVMRRDDYRILQAWCVGGADAIRGIMPQGVADSFTLTQVSCRPDRDPVWIKVRVICPTDSEVLRDTEVGLLVGV